MKLTIDNLGMNGEGISRACIEHDKVIFVPYTITGEEIEAEIVQEKPKFCVAKLKQVIVPSLYRVEPPCAYYYKCGGCNLQHIDYVKQLEFKQNLVKDTLRKVGGIDVDILACEPSVQYGYRNKAVFHLSDNIGMFEEGSHDTIEMDKCLLMNDSINRVLNIVATWIRRYNVKTFNFTIGKGLLKYLVVRSVGNQTLVCLVATSDKVQHLEKLYEMLCEVGEVGLYLNINMQNNSIILGKRYIHIAGIQAITLNEFDIKYEVDVASFLQVNNHIKHQLYSEVITNVYNEIVIDAYAGAGLLSAILSTKANKVYSVEIVPEASNKAQKLVKTNNIANMEVINGDCTQILPRLMKKVKNENKNADCLVVLDPAHAGCDSKVIEAVKVADKIVYIACNPIALAKDLKVLQSTHKIVKIKPYDMFPNTKHVETLAILEKIN